MKVSAMAGMFITCLYFVIAVFGDKKDAMARREMKPKSYTRFIISFVVVALMYKPMTGIKLVGDMTGMGRDGLPACFVSDVSMASGGWEVSASQCMDMVSQQVKALSGFGEIPAIGVDSLRVFVGFIQFISIIMIGMSLWGILMHMIGFRNQSISMSGYVWAYFAANIIFMTPNAIPYFLDISGRGTVPIINTGG